MHNFVTRSNICGFSNRKKKLLKPNRKEQNRLRDFSGMITFSGFLEALFSKNPRDGNILSHKTISYEPNLLVFDFRGP